MPDILWIVSARTCCLATFINSSRLFGRGERAGVLDRFEQELAKAGRQGVAVREPCDIRRLLAPRNADHVVFNFEVIQPRLVERGDRL